LNPYIFIAPAGGVQATAAPAKAAEAKKEEKKEEEADVDMGGLFGDEY
jgi:ribosomal protein L12E/L44/L45/RPP1/RPP2